MIVWGGAMLLLHPIASVYDDLGIVHDDHLAPIA